MKKKLRIIKKLLILLESEVNKTSGSSSQDETPLEKRQPGTTWVSSPGHWGAKNAAGNVKYFTNVDTARDYSEGGAGETGADTQPDDAGAKKQPPVTTDNLWNAGGGYWAAKSPQGVVKYFTNSSMATFHAQGHATTGGTLLAPPGATPQKPPATTPSTASTASATDVEKQKKPGTAWSAGEGYWGGKNAQGEVKYFTASLKYTASEAAWDFAEGENTGEAGVATLPKQTQPAAATPPATTDADSHEPETFWDAGDGYWGGKNAKGVVKYFGLEGQAELFAKGAIKGVYGLDKLPGETPADTTAPTASTPATATDADSHEPETAWNAGEGYWGAKNAQGVVKYFENPLAAGMHRDGDDIEGGIDNPPEAGVAKRKPKTRWDTGKGYWGAKNAQGVVKYFADSLDSVYTGKERAQDFADGWNKGITALDSLPTSAPTSPTPATTDADSHEPETIWDAGNDYWGAKNANGVVKYFTNYDDSIYDAEEHAQEFASGGSLGVSGIDKLPGKTPAATTPPTPAATTADKQSPKTSWNAGQGYWGAKSPAGEVKYFTYSADSVFSAEDRAKEFAAGWTTGKTGIDKLPWETPGATTAPPAATTAPTSPTGAPPYGDKQPPKTSWNAGQGYWGAKNINGAIKYFTDSPSSGYTGEDLAYNWADGYQWTAAFGVDALPGTTPPISVEQSSQEKYVQDISGFIAKNKTLTFDATSEDVSEYSIGGIPFDYGSINPDFETEYDDTALQLPNGKHIEMFQLLQTDDGSSIENDPAAKTKEELGGLRYSAGVIIEEDDGRIWILKPTNGFGGYDYTFPKGGLDTDILDKWGDYDEYDRNVALRSAAVREAFEETGLVVQIQGYLGDIQRTTSHNRYFIARRVGGTPINFDPAETEKTLLMHPGEALKSLNSPYDAKLMAMYAEYRKNNPKEIKMGSPDEEPMKIDFSHIYKGKLSPYSQTAIAILGTQKPGTQAGSNPGGLYIGTDGKERYVKMYSNKSQGAGEHLANVIYNCLGISAPSSGLIDDNAVKRYYSDIIPNVQTLQQVGLNKERARNILKGFVADILTANWDAVGLANDNIVFEPNSDVPIRIDNGGTFLVRAQGAPKTSIPGYTDSSLDDITEYKTFLDPSINPNYARVFAASGYTEAEFEKEVKKQVKRMLKVVSFFGGWSAVTDQVFANTLGSVSFTDQGRFARMLDARTLKLAQRFGLVADMDMDVETKPTMHVNDFYAIEDSITVRYDLKRDMAKGGETGPYPILADAQSNLVVANRDIHEAVVQWKDQPLWKRTIRERFDILKTVSNFLRHTSAANLELLAPIVQRGMAFTNDAVFRLFMRNFRKGKITKLLPSGFSTTMSPVYSFGELGSQSATSVIIQVRPASGHKISGVHISHVPELNNSYQKHKGEQEIIVSDMHQYEVQGIYKQPIMINNQMEKLVYIVELEQKPISFVVTEAVKLDDDINDKIAKYVLDICMMGTVRTQMPTEQDFRKMLKK